MDNDEGDYTWEPFFGTYQYRKRPHHESSQSAPSRRSSFYDPYEFMKSHDPNENMESDDDPYEDVESDDPYENRKYRDPYENMISEDPYVNIQSDFTFDESPANVLQRSLSNCSLNADRGDDWEEDTDDSQDQQGRQSPRGRQSNQSPRGVTISVPATDSRPRVARGQAAQGLAKAAPRRKAGQRLAKPGPRRREDEPISEPEPDSLPKPRATRRIDNSDRENLEEADVGPASVLGAQPTPAPRATSSTGQAEKSAFRDQLAGELQQFAIQGALRFVPEEHSRRRAAAAQTTRRRRLPPRSMPHAASQDNSWALPKPLSDRENLKEADVGSTNGTSISRTRPGAAPTGPGSWRTSPQVSLQAADNGGASVLGARPTPAPQAASATGQSSTNGTLFPRTRPGTAPTGTGSWRTSSRVFLQSAVNGALRFVPEEHSRRRAAAGHVVAPSRRGLGDRAYPETVGDKETYTKEELEAIAIIRRGDIPVKRLRWNTMAWTKMRWLTAPSVVIEQGPSRVHPGDDDNVIIETRLRIRTADGGFRSADCGWDEFKQYLKSHSVVPRIFLRQEGTQSQKTLYRAVMDQFYKKGWFKMHYRVLVEYLHCYINYQALTQGRHLERITSIAKRLNKDVAKLSKVVFWENPMADIHILCLLSLMLDHPIRLYDLTNCEETTIGRTTISSDPILIARDADNQYMSLRPGSGGRFADWRCTCDTKQTADSCNKCSDWQCHYCGSIMSGYIDYCLNPTCLRRKDNNERRQHNRDPGWRCIRCQKPDNSMEDTNCTECGVRRGVLHIYIHSLRGWDFNDLALEEDFQYPVEGADDQEKNWGVLIQAGLDGGQYDQQGREIVDPDVDGGARQDINDERGGGAVDAARAFDPNWELSQEERDNMRNPHYWDLTRDEQERDDAQPYESDVPDEEDNEDKDEEKFLLHGFYDDAGN